MSKQTVLLASFLSRIVVCSEKEFKSDAGTNYKLVISSVRQGKYTVPSRCTPCLFPLNEEGFVKIFGSLENNSSKKLQLSL